MPSAVPSRGRILSDVIANTNLNGLFQRGIDERICIHELIPGHHEAIQRRRGDTRFCHRENHLDKRLKSATSVNQRRLLDLPRNLEEKRTHIPDRKRKNERAVDDDQTGMRINQSHIFHDNIVGNGKQHARKHFREQDTQLHFLLLRQCCNGRIHMPP